MYSYYIVLRSVWSIFNFLLHLHIFFLFLYIFSCFYLTWHTSICRKVNINCLYIFFNFSFYMSYYPFFIGIYLYFTFSSHFHTFFFVLFRIFCYILLILYLIAILFDFKLFQRWFISSKRRCNITASSWEVSEPKSLRPVPSRRS